MTINNLFDKLNKDCDSKSSQYDKIIELATYVFCSYKFNNLEKRETYLEILALYGQLDKED